MNLIDITCPKCGAIFEVNSERKEFFCTYCGNKVLIDDGSYTVTHIYIDKTKEKEIELLQKQLAFEKEQARRVEIKTGIRYICIALAIVSTILTALIVKSNFNIMFNFAILIIGLGCAVGRLMKKAAISGIVILSFLIIAICVGFIALKDDFNSNFTLVVVAVIALNTIASLAKKNDG